MFLKHSASQTSHPWAGLGPWLKVSNINPFHIHHFFFFGAPFPSNHPVRKAKSLHFTDEETEAQGGQVVCPMSRS